MIKYGIRYITFRDWKKNEDKFLNLPVIIYIFINYQKKLILSNKKPNF